MVTRWFSWGPYTRLDEPQAYIERLAGERERGERLDLLVIHREHGPAGITGLSEFSARDRRCMVGTWFGRRFWGTGANEESKALMAHLAFVVLGLGRLGAYSNIHNAQFGAGEIRGILTRVDEPALTWLLVAGCGIAFVLRRRPLSRR